MNSFTGRCYIPNDYMSGDELMHLNNKSPHLIPNAQLKRYAEKLADLGDFWMDEAIGGVNLLPHEIGRWMFTLCRGHQDIGKLIRRHSHLELRISPSLFEKVRLILKCMYFTSIPSMHKCDKQK